LDSRGTDTRDAFAPAPPTSIPYLKLVFKEKHALALRVMGLNRDGERFGALQPLAAQNPSPHVRRILQFAASRLGVEQSWVFA